MPYTIQQLASEIANDPKSLGYQLLVETGYDEVIANRLNSPTSAGAELITLERTDKNTFLAGTLPCCVRLALGLDTTGQSLPAGVVAKWNAVFAQARAADPGSNINLSLLTTAALGDPVNTDKVITQEEFDALTKRVGSRAEVLWGQGTVVSPEHVARAR